MDPLSFFSGLLISLIGIIGVTYNNYLNTKKELALAKIARDGADRDRLLTQKQAAYAALLKESSQATERFETPPTEPGSDQIFFTDLTSAVAQARLVSTEATGQLISDFHKAFFQSYGREGEPERELMMAAFRRELGIED